MVADGDRVFVFRKGPAMKLNDLVEDIGLWGDETFDHRRRSCLLPIVKHLIEEANELLDKPEKGEEMADVFILLCCAADVAKVDLQKEVDRKMSINRSRQWGEPNHDGVTHHL